MNKTIQLTENELKHFIMESVKTVLQESDETDLQNRLMMANNEIKKLSFREPLKPIIDKYFPDFRPYNTEQRDYMWEMMGLPDGYQVLGEIEDGTLIANMKTRELGFSQESSLTIPSRTH